MAGGQTPAVFTKVAEKRAHFKSADISGPRSEPESSALDLVGFHPPGQRTIGMPALSGFLELIVPDTDRLADETTIRNTGQQM